MLPRDYDTQVCSIARTLEIVGERWTLLILRDVFLGLRRFDELQEHLGIARNVLSKRLDVLVAEGDPRARPLPGAPRALRVPPDRQGSRPLADHDGPAAVGRQVRGARRPAAITRGRERRTEV